MHKLYTVIRNNDLELANTIYNNLSNYAKFCLKTGGIWREELQLDELLKRAVRTGNLDTVKFVAGLYTPLIYGIKNTESSAFQIACINDSHDIMWFLYNKNPVIIDDYCLILSSLVLQNSYHSIKELLKMNYYVETDILIHILNRTNCISSDILQLLLDTYPNIINNSKLYTIITDRHNKHLLNIIVTNYNVIVENNIVTTPINSFAIYGINKLITKPIYNGISDDLCIICFEGTNVYKLSKCSHHFHKNCIEVWLAKDNRCPYCRTVVIQ
jgi:hypothetical protein